jgi:2-amino-4-hydroxy-6-hydroxymethyldihydropteridine diphosphokinase
LDHLETAVTALAELGRIERRSSIWETAPIGPEQPDYLNAAVVIDTVIAPRPLLSQLHRIESAAGRIRRERWGPRPLDLDVLLYADAVLDADGLRVPHPRLHERRFVLEPLAEVWPDPSIPTRGLITELLSAVSDQDVSRAELQWALPTYEG